MLLFVLTATAVVASADPVPDSTMTARKNAHATFVGCGIAADRVELRYEPDLQDEVVEISGAEKLPPATIDCIARLSLKTGYFVTFGSPALQEVFQRVHEEMGYRQGVERAQAWMNERKLLTAMPRPGEELSIAAYGEAVETFCGIARRSLLVAFHDSLLTFAPDGLGKLTPDGYEAALSNEQFECVTMSLIAADLAQRNWSFGIIGNERYADGAEPATEAP